jgi:hypothetical protein
VVTLDRLESLLEAEAQGYAAFLTRLPLKLALIKKGQVAPLETFVAREAEEQQKLRQLERERIAVSSEVAHDLGLPADATLAEILPKVPADRRARLGVLRDRLITQSEKLKEGNERCDLLLRASLDFIKYSLEVIGTILNPEERLADMIYGPGESGPAKSGSVLLNRTA